MKRALVLLAMAAACSGITCVSFAPPFVNTVVPATTVVPVAVGCDPLIDPTCGAVPVVGCDPAVDPLCGGGGVGCDPTIDPLCGGGGGIIGCDPTIDPTCPGFIGCDPTIDPLCG